MVNIQISKGRTQTPEGEPDKPDDNPDSGETDNGSEPEPQEPQVGYASVSVALPDNTDMAHVVISVDGMVQYLSLIHILRAFLEHNADFAAVPWAHPVCGARKDGMATLLPPVHDTDGFFIAKLRRNA